MPIPNIQIGKTQCPVTSGEISTIGAHTKPSPGAYGQFQHLAAPHIALDVIGQNI